jgi:hypothetical protein
MSKYNENKIVVQKMNDWLGCGEGALRGGEGQVGR